jgi:tetratricopeptide (TPR) repeat protein
MKIAVLAFWLCTSLVVVAQNQPSRPNDSTQNSEIPQNDAPPRSDDDATTPDPHFPRGETSSSKDTGVDITPPKDDASKHPFSKAEVEGDEGGDGGSGGADVQEFHPWDPHRAIKDIEVGDFYLRRKNYRAAEDRYREALVYKPDDAMANLRLGETLEKLGERDEARQHYQEYLKILPEGPLAKEAHQGLERLDQAEAGKR